MNFLRAALSDRALNVTEFARLVGRSRRTIFNWRTGRTEPSPRDVIRIAELLEVAPEFLLMPFSALNPNT